MSYGRTVASTVTKGHGRAYAVTPESKKIGNEALHWRDVKGVTLATVTMYTGIPGPHITRFEKTGRGLSNDAREKLARYYGIPANSFIEPDEDIEWQLDAETPGALVYADMKARNLTQWDLSKAAGIHFTEVSRLIRGERSMTIEKAVRFAEALGVDPASYVTAIALRDLKLYMESRAVDAETR